MAIEMLTDLKGKKIKKILNCACNCARIIFEDGEQLTIMAELDSTPAGILPIVQLSIDD